jgi:hypothetical protein
MANLTPTVSSSSASGRWLGILVHTTGIVNNGTVKVVAGCTFSAPNGGGPGQTPPRASGRPARINCEGPGTGHVPPFPVPSTGNHWVLGWRIGFMGLSGPATSAVIRLNSPGSAGTIAATLCTQCTSGKFGHVTVTDDQANALIAGHGYVVVNTAANPTGELSGQIVKLPLTPAGH